MEVTDPAGVLTEGSAGEGRGLRWTTGLVLAAWVLTLGVDLFIHAGVMAGFYVREIPFLVDPVTAFRRIPAVIAILLLGCGSGDAGEAGEAAAPVPDSVREELVQLGERDQAEREGFTPEKMQDSVFLMTMLRGDSLRTRRLRQIVDRYGWPTRAAVGPEAANAAFLILQHSPVHEFQRSMVPLLEGLAQEGAMPPSQVAMLVDRVLVQEGKQQRYGTQFSVEDGELVMHPVEAEEGLDDRRRQMRLPPIEEYRRLLEEHYQAPVRESGG